MGHPDPDQYAGQRMFVVQHDDDLYLVPFLEDEHTVFLNEDSPESEADEAVPR